MMFHRQHFQKQRIMYNSLLSKFQLKEFPASVLAG